MQRARRLASVAVLATLAVAGLSACRQEPSVAVYVGDTARITESRVETVFDQVRKAQAGMPAAEPGAAAAAAITRTDVVRTLISVDVLDRVAAGQSVTVPADLPLNDYATALRLPPDAEYVRQFARIDAVTTLLRQKAQNAPPATDADLREVFDVLVSVGGANGDFASFKTSLPEQNKQLVQQAAAVRNEIAKVTGPMRIKVNPRYQPLGIPVLNFQDQTGGLRPLIVAPLGPNKDTVPVTDLS